MSLRALPHDGPRPSVRGMSFDLPGAVAFTAFVGAIVAALFLATDGVSRWLPAAAAAVVFLVVFIRIERRVRDPFVALSLFNRRPYVGATATVLLHNLVMYSLLLIIPILAERELGLGPSGAGLLIGAMTGAMMVVSPVGGHLSDRLGRRTPVLIGSAIAVVATVGLVLIAGAPGVAGHGRVRGPRRDRSGSRRRITADHRRRVGAGRDGRRRERRVHDGALHRGHRRGGPGGGGRLVGRIPTGFVVLAVAAVLSMVSAGALATTGAPREQAAASA